MLTAADSITIDLPTPGSIAFWFAVTILGIPVTLLIPALFINWLLTWARAAETTAGVSAVVASRVYGYATRRVSPPWKALLALVLAVTLTYLMFRTADQFVWERFLGHHLTWAERGAYLITGAPKGWTATTAALLTAGLLLAWTWFAIIRSETAAVVARALAWGTARVWFFFAIIIGAIAAFGFILWVLTGMGSANGSTSEGGLALLAGTAQLAALALFCLAAGGALVLVEDRFEIAYG